MLHFCAAWAKCVSPSASVVPAYNNTEPAGGQLASFALSIHAETSEGQEGGEEPASEPALRLALLRGPRALQGSRDGRSTSLKDEVLSTVMAVARTAGTERGSITGFNNWRLTYSGTPLISLRTDHLESKEYIAYLCLRNTLSGQKLRQCLCLLGLRLALGMLLPPLPAWCVRQKEDPCGTLLGWLFGIGPQEEISSGCTKCLLTGR